MMHQERVLIDDQNKPRVSCDWLGGGAIVPISHVSETLARCLGCFMSPVSALRRLDLPTFDLPTRASSGRRASGGGIYRSAAPAAPRQTGKSEGARAPGHGERNGGGGRFECRTRRHGQTVGTADPVYERSPRLSPRCLRWSNMPGAKYYWL